ncbi:MAG TPA: Fe-S cluster assembly protein SufD [Gammaproteobacteria bacterium]|nr:Fe-S cluster assembly protein SufD [Gammaproteobacteria bacterium]
MSEIAVESRLHELRKFVREELPSRKNELWKYTEIKGNLIPEEAGEQREFRITDRVRSIKKISSIQFVFINGHFAENLSNTKDLPTGVTLSPLDQILNAEKERYLSREFDVKKFPFARLNSSMMTNGMFLEIPKNTVIEKPIHLLFINTEQNEFLTNPRNIIIVNQEACVTIIEDHLAENAKRYFTNVVTDIYAKNNSKICYYKIQDDDLSAAHVANVFIQQNQGSSVKTFFLSKGAHLEREDLSVFQKESSAETEMQGLYRLSQDNQHIDHHIHIDHLAAHGTSSMLYKGILEKKSRAVFNGKVYVHPHTKQINAHQANHNLLLSKDAEVNSKPELEIYAEDVKCTHGATVGQLDEEALFYLRSRGLDKNEAYKLLIKGFLEEIYDKIEDENLRHYIRDRMCSHDE